MPLIKENLVHELKKIMDSSYPEYENFPNKGEVSIRWTEAIHTYAKDVIPAVVPTSQEIAKSTLLSSWQALEVDALIAFPAGLTAYTLSLGLGMQPTFTATPPPTPIVLIPVFTLGLAGGSGAQCAEMMAELIHQWFKTGIAINNSSGATIPWS